jgi:hypothetical protein
MRIQESKTEVGKPRVLNLHTDSIPPGAVYVGRGRGSKWGNPFRIGRDGTRDEVIAKYEKWIRRQPQLMEALRELEGKDLVCFCAPRACHADILLKLVNHP